MRALAARMLKSELARLHVTLDEVALNCDYSLGRYACSGTEFNIDTRLPYIVSLLYLSIFGTVIAFACYFVLLKDIGPEKASYSVVLFPVVAVTLSMIFEGFVWQTSTVIGFVLVLTGNVVVLTPIDKIKALIIGVKSIEQGTG